MSKYPAGKIKIRDTEFPVFVDEFGLFSSVWQGERIGETETQAELQVLLTKATKEAANEVAVPFSVAVMQGPSGQRKQVIKRGNGVAIHAGNGNLIVEWPGGDRQQDSGGWGGPLSGTVLHRLDEENEQHWLSLLAGVAKAQTMLKKFEDEHKIGLKEEVKAGIARKMTEGQHGQD